MVLWSYDKVIRSHFCNRFVIYGLNFKVLLFFAELCFSIAENIFHLPSTHHHRDFSLVASKRLTRKFPLIDIQK